MERQGSGDIVQVLNLAVPESINIFPLLFIYCHNSLSLAFCHLEDS